MAFVAGRALSLGAGVAVPLPSVTDASGNNRSFTLYSHMRVPGGATYTFDSGQALIGIPVNTDTVIPIPVNATTITSSAASTCQVGQMM
jgi:hypothetical protein